MSEILEHLRHRKIHSKLVHLQTLKEILCHKRLTVAARQKRAQWTQLDLGKVLRSLKNNQCRDPQGLIHELFKTGTAGTYI